MDVKALAGTTRSGRRNALAGLFAGTAALLGQRLQTEAGKHRCSRCPHRICCLCDASSAAAGCHLKPFQADARAVCSDVCGGSDHIGGVSSSDSSALTLVCGSAGSGPAGCIFARCPI